MFAVQVLTLERGNNQNSCLFFLLAYLKQTPPSVSLREGHSFLCLPKEKNQKKGPPCRWDNPGRRGAEPAGQKFAALKQFAPSSGPAPRRPAQRQWPHTSPNIPCPSNPSLGGINLVGLRQSPSAGEYKTIRWRIKCALFFASSLALIRWTLERPGCIPTLESGNDQGFPFIVW